MDRYKTPPTTWDEVLAGYAPDIAGLAEEVRQLIKRELPDLNESVGGAKKMGYTQFWRANRQDVVCMVSPEDEHVKLYFHGVTQDATGQLKVEGTGKNARHVKLREVPEAAIKELLAQLP